MCVFDSYQLYKPHSKNPQHDSFVIIITSKQTNYFIHLLLHLVAEEFRCAPLLQENYVLSAPISVHIYTTTIPKTMFPLSKHHFNLKPNTILILTCTSQPSNSMSYPPQVPKTNHPFRKVTHKVSIFTLTHIFIPS